MDLQSGYYFDYPPTGKGTVLHGVPGALALHGAHDINVSNCSFEHLGLTGVLSDAGTRGLRVVGSTISDVSGSGIALGNVSSPMTPADKQDGQFYISGNKISDTGAEYSGCAGIVAGYVVEMSLVHNHLANCSNGCIAIGWVSTVHTARNVDTVRLWQA